MKGRYGCHLTIQAMQYDITYDIDITILLQLYETKQQSEIKFSVAIKIIDNYT